MRKEAGKFASSPVFVINAGFGLVLYVVAVILVCTNMDSVIDMMAKMGVEISAEAIINYMPACMFGLVFVMSMTTSITSSKYRAYERIKPNPRTFLF